MLLCLESGELHHYHGADDHATVVFPALTHDEILHECGHHAVESGGAVVGAEVYVGHLLHLLDIGEEVGCLGADDDVGAHAMLGEPFGLGIDGGRADASGYKEDSMSIGAARSISFAVWSIGAMRSIRGEELNEVGGLAEGTGEVEEEVAFLKGVDLFGGAADGLGDDGHGAGRRVVVADGQGNTFAELVDTNDDELTREGRFGYTGCEDLHLGDGGREEAFAYDLEHNLSNDYGRSPPAP